MTVLGFGGSGHDWSTCAIDGGRIVAVDEERLARRKYGVGCDLLAAGSRAYCLDAVGRPGGPPSAVAACDLVPRAFYFGLRGRTTVINHHLAHAYSTFCASGYERAAVLVADNSGSLLQGVKADSPERVVETISYFAAGPEGIELLERVSGAHLVDAPTESAYYQPGSTDNSLGHLYRCASLAIGLAFQPQGARHAISEDGKTMGLAPYGDERYRDQIGELVELLPGGRVRIDARRVEDTLAGIVRRDGGDFACRAGVAWAVQHHLERALLGTARWLHERTGCDDLCIAGGVGLNSVANGRILRETPFRRVFVVPAAGDNGISLGAAYYAMHHLREQPLRTLPALHDAYLGRTYGQDRMDAALADRGLRWETPPDLPAAVAERLARGRLVAWFDGGSEFGPRALGHRSILSAPWPAAMRDDLNDRVKHREWFRPYAPVVPLERAPDYFEVEGESPYMLIVCGVRRPDAIPAVTHVDGSARLQTLARATNPRLHALLEAFGGLTGHPVVLNTSFNTAGQPIVETPEEAADAFLAMELDDLALGERLVSKVRP